MTASALNNLWTYLSGLSLSINNRKWLASKLLEPAVENIASEENSLTIEDIPEEFRCNPYDISPSGDIFWADKRNVDELNRRIADLESGKDKIVATCRSKKELEAFLESL